MLNKRMGSLETLAHTIHALRNLPQHERMLAAPNIIKSALELADADETAFVISMLSLTLASKPDVVLETGVQWVDNLRRTRKRKRHAA